MAPASYRSNATSICFGKKSHGFAANKLKSKPHDARKVSLEMISVSSYGLESEEERLDESTSFQPFRFPAAVFFGFITRPVLLTCVPGPAYSSPWIPSMGMVRKAEE